MAPVLNTKTDGDTLELKPKGAWTAINSKFMEQLSEDVAPQIAAAKLLTIDMAKIGEIDTIGAWVLEKLSRHAAELGRTVQFKGISVNYAELIDEVRQLNRSSPLPHLKPNPIIAKLDEIGRSAWSATTDIAVFLEMLGALGAALLGLLRRSRSLRLTSLAYQVYRVGWQAVPIMVLITFLIGAIIAQQGIFLFRKFGADLYVADMVGILVLREIGVLIIAIMVAGRSGSAYTAELGSMKMREEIDALSTMGLDPVEVLILPRIIALVITLPILAFIGSMVALYGGLLTAWFYGGMQPSVFIARLHEAVSLNSFQVGMWKAPFMALVIGVVACSEGLRVKGSAESLGLQTTTSVVKSIFMVIVLDGLFAMFFASIGM